MLNTSRALTLIIALLPGIGYACSCRYWRLPEEEQIRLAFEQSSLVVFVRVAALEIKEGGPPVRNTISGQAEILKTFKSPVDHLRQIEIKIVNPEISSSCGEGASPELGDYILLYLQTPTITEEDFIFCSRSRIVKNRAEASSELAELGRLAGHES